MSIRPVHDNRTHLPPAQSPKIRACRFTGRLLRPTLHATTGVAREKGYMFTQVELPEDEAKDYDVPQYASSEHVKLRYKFSNRDLWDTLTRDVVDMMVNPPEEYDPDYQRQVNIAMLTSLKTLENRTKH